MVEDDPSQKVDLAQMVVSLGYECATAGDGREALGKLTSFSADAILADLVMPRMDGIALLKELAARGDHTPVIILTALGSIEQALSIMHDLKAFWFLEKPIQPVVMRSLLERAIRQNGLVQETNRLRRELSYRGVLGDLVGDSPAMQEVFSQIRQVAPTSASVLITGESGTGKELVARAIHQLSPHSDGPFVAVNCAALPETLMESELFGHERGAFTGAIGRSAGCFEQANNGTLLLDEIAEMPIGTQAKLLRVIEESKVRRLGGTCDMPVSVRVLAATNRPPAQAVQSKHLREDLYYRLNVFHLPLPPLRDHKEDIPAIAAAMIRNLNRKHDCRVTNLSPEVLWSWEEYSWPGNVRELRNLVERAVIVAGEGEIRLGHLPGGSGAPQLAPPKVVSSDVLQARVGSPIAEVEEAYIRLTLRHAANNKRRAAQILGLCPRTLHYKLRQYENRHAKSVAAGES